MELQNATEVVVWKYLDDVVKQSGGCTCDRCRMDTAAMALNSLDPQYVVTERGLVFTKIRDMEQQNHADVIGAIASACGKVMQNPRHDQQD